MPRDLWLLLTLCGCAPPVSATSLADLAPWIWDSRGGVQLAAEQDGLAAAVFARLDAEFTEAPGTITLDAARGEWSGWVASGVGLYDIFAADWLCEGGCDRDCAVYESWTVAEGTLVVRPSSGSAGAATTWAAAGELDFVGVVLHDDDTERELALDDTTWAWDGAWNSQDDGYFIPRRPACGAASE